MIRTEFFGSESLAECSYQARLCFIGLWCYANDEGLMAFKPRSIKSFVFPLDDVSMEEFCRLLAELEEEGCVELYVNRGSVYLRVPNFGTYQTISHPQKSNIPSDSGNVPVSLRECSWSVPPKQLIKQLINKAQGGREDAPPATAEEIAEICKSLSFGDAERR